MARLGRLLLCLLIFHSTEFEDLDESHLFALTTTDLVADGPDHVSGQICGLASETITPANALLDGIFLGRRVRSR